MRHRLPRQASLSGSGLMATYLVVFAMLACPMSFCSRQASIAAVGLGRAGGVAKAVRVHREADLGVPPGGRDHLVDGEPA